MAANSTVIVYETLKSLNVATLTGSFIPIGAPSTHPARIFKIINESNVGVTISTDGINAHDYLPAGTSYTVYDVGTNLGTSAPELALPPTQFYALGSAGTGFVYVVILYANTPNPRIPL